MHDPMGPPRPSSSTYATPASLPRAALFLLLTPWISGCEQPDPETTSAESSTAPVANEAPAELADGLLTVIVFPVVDEPFIAPNLAAGPFPTRGSAKHFSGIDIDIMVAFAGASGFEVEFMRLDEPGFGALLPALVAGEGDMVASALTITEERQTIVDFSRPYFTVSTVVVARTGSGIREIADLEGRVGVGVRGSRPIARLRHHGISSEIQEADFQTGAYAEVSDGNVDFAVMESASARFSVANRNNLEITVTFPEREHYGFAMAKDSRLKPLLDQFLEEIEANGELERIVTHHLGPSPSTH